MPPTVRTATPADAPTIAELWQRAWYDGHRGHVPDALLAARDAAYFVDRAAALVEHTLVVDGAAALSGVVITRDDEVQQLMVADTARGRGVGDALLAAAGRRIAAAGHRSAWLAVVPGNATARAFYARRGWVDQGEEVYRAQTLGANTVAVAVRRYVRALT